jgi:hypothetical protein
MVLPENRKKFTRKKLGIFSKIRGQTARPQSGGEPFKPRRGFGSPPGARIGSTEPVFVYAKENFVKNFTTTKQKNPASGIEISTKSR